VKTIAVTETTYFRWPAEYGRMKNDQVKRLNELEVDNARLRRAVSDLTLDKLSSLRPPQETPEPRPSPQSHIS
jgi:putative transposase